MSEDLISILSEIRSQYNCFDPKEEPYYHALSEAINLASAKKMQLSKEDSTFDSKTQLSDSISRMAAIDAIRKDMYADKDYMSAMICDGIESVLRDLPSEHRKLDEWCTDCKEYDQERHCCPRWNRVIRNTVEEIKTEHLPSVQERKGHDTGESRWFHCSECGYGVFDVYLDDEQKYDLAYHYCPNCGAHMEGSEE